MPSAAVTNWQNFDPGTLASACLHPGRRLLVFGEPGSGKSRLCSELADALDRQDRTALCLTADPGSPAFGQPGTLSLGRRQRGQWRVLAREALCTLDAGRFRLPLIQAVARLVAEVDDLPLLIDAPGLTRGLAAAELLMALVETAEVDTVVVLTQTDALPLPEELAALTATVIPMRCHPQARPPTSNERCNQRSQRWAAFLETCEPRTVNLHHWRLVGTPPPRFAPDAWIGRQIALLDGQRTLALGEVRSLDAGQLDILTEPTQAGDTLLVRNAIHDANDTLVTASDPVSRAPAPAPVLLGEPNRPMTFSIGRITATLHNGVFGDPLLEIAFNSRRHCVLFDIGEAGHLPARLAHRVSDVFISHAHFDHIGGFPWLLRARLLNLPPCRLYGPPGLARHIAHWIGGVRWDRIGDQAPIFVIQEVHADHIQRFRIQTGGPLIEEGQTERLNGLLLDEPGFRVRTLTLDHDIPVLAFALEHASMLSIRETALRELGLTPGPWLGALKRAVQHHRLSERLTLPDGTEQTVGRLAQHLVDRSPGERLVYATDLADSPDNRIRLIEFARDADAFVCEAPFLDTHRDQAYNTQHLTARACGEIAAAASVKRLVPFHFSRRYKGNAAAVYREIEAGYGQAAPITTE